eukprot:5208934-Amphidinium_carterae.1
MMIRPRPRKVGFPEVHLWETEQVLLEYLICNRHLRFGCWGRAKTLEEPCHKPAAHLHHYAPTHINTKISHRPKTKLGEFPRKQNIATD